LRVVQPSTPPKISELSLSDARGVMIERNEVGILPLTTIAGIAATVEEVCGMRRVIVFECVGRKKKKRQAASSCIEDSLRRAPHLTSLHPLIAEIAVARLSIIVDP
jgi:hypothetical protein